mgnify:CR=1 FL=1
MRKQGRTGQGGDWGRVCVGRDADGHLFAELENGTLFCRYGWRNLPRTDEGFIVDLRHKGFPENHAADSPRHVGRIDAAGGRGPLTAATVVADGPDVKTVRLEWKPLQGPPPVSEVSIYPDGAYLRYDYLVPPLNVVDIAMPGGSTGVYQVYGASAWKRGYVGYPKVYFDRNPAHVGVDPYDLPGVDDDAGPLDYRGWFIMGIFNPANGRGFGRILPVRDIDIVKLLFADNNQGFEFCTHRYVDIQARTDPFTGYLYLVTGGAEEVIAAGKRLADAQPLR